MARSVAVEQSRAIPVSVEEAFARTLPIPLPRICSRWYGAIPPIKAIHDQSGDWDAAGRTRRITMVGGGSVFETLTNVTPPQSFAYTLSDIKGPMAALVSSVDGTWRFAAAGTGTTVTWQWIIHPKSGLSAPLLPAFGRMWRGYARGVLERLSAELVG